MSDALLIFSRFPRLGKVKTRLSPPLTSAQCFELHSSFLLDTLDRIASVNAAHYLFLADCSIQEIRQFTHDHALEDNFFVFPQSGQDLGERMWNAYQKVSKFSHRVLIMGSDTPSVPLTYVEQAWAKLKRYPVVVGPVKDGGYYLLALTQPRKNLFENIDWGTHLVMEQTLSKMSDREYFLLPPWYDVDTPTDLHQLKDDLEKGFEGFPGRTYQLLRKQI